MRRGTTRRLPKNIARRKSLFLHAAWNFLCQRRTLSVSILLLDQKFIPSLFQKVQFLIKFLSLYLTLGNRLTNKQIDPLIDRGCGRIGARTGKESTWPGFQLSFYSVSFCFIHMANFHYKKQIRAPSSFLWLLTLGDLHLRTQHQKVS